MAAQCVEPLVPLRAGLREAIARLATARSDETSPASLSVARCFETACRVIGSSPVSSVAVAVPWSARKPSTWRLLGSARAEKTCPRRDRVIDGERGGLQPERGRPGGRGLDDREPRALVVVDERELDLALLVPLERSRSPGSTSRTVACRDSPFPHRKLALAAGAQVELDVVREPALELLAGRSGPTTPRRGWRGARSPCESSRPPLRNLQVAIE